MAKNYRQIILQKIEESESSIFLRSDFTIKSSYQYTNKLLKNLVEEGFLIKAGHGIYVRTRINRINGNIMCDHQYGIDGALLEIFERLNIPYSASEIVNQYLNGCSSQIPAKLNITLPINVKRKLILGYYRINC